MLVAHFLTWYSYQCSFQSILATVVYLPYSSVAEGLLVTVTECSWDSRGR
jgi:hypothetical protein